MKIQTLIAKNKKSGGFLWMQKSTSKLPIKFQYRLLKKLKEARTRISKKYEVMFLKKQKK
jgi:hypothetical protein